MKKMTISLTIIIVICIAGGLGFSIIKKEYSSYDVVLKEYIKELEEQCADYEDMDFNSTADCSFEIESCELILSDFGLKLDDVSETEKIQKKIIKLMDGKSENWINLITDKNISRAAQLIIADAYVNNSISYMNITGDPVNGNIKSGILNAEEMLSLLYSDNVSLCSKIALCQAVSYPIPKNIEDNWYDCLVDIMNSIEGYNNIYYFYENYMNYTYSNDSFVLKDRLKNMAKDWFENSRDVEKIVFACKIKSVFYDSERNKYIDKLQEIFIDSSQNEQLFDLEEGIIGIFLFDINTFKSNKFLLEFVKQNVTSTGYTLILVDRIKTLIALNPESFVTVFFNENTDESFKLAAYSLEIIKESGQTEIYNMLFNKFQILQKQKVT